VLDNVNYYANMQSVDTGYKGVCGSPVTATATSKTACSC